MSAYIVPGFGAEVRVFDEKQEVTAVGRLELGPRTYNADGSYSAAVQFVGRNVEPLAEWQDSPAMRKPLTSEELNGI